MTPDDHHDSNRELIGQGLGNIAAGALFVHRMSELGIYRDETLIGTSDSCEVTPEVDPRIVAYRLDGPLFFGAAERFVEITTAQPEMRFLILRMRRVSMIDTTGIMAFLNIQKKLRRRGCELLLSGPQDQVAVKLKDSRAWD